MSSKTLFIEAVRTLSSLPESLREHAGDVTDLEEHSFDESYIEFIDTQIRLNPRGPEWMARLVRRRATLQHFCGVTLLRGRVKTGGLDFTVEVHPETKAVIHWEEF
jgi:hypothetical protein